VQPELHGRGVLHWQLQERQHLHARLRPSMHNELLERGHLSVKLQARAATLIIKGTVAVAVSLSVTSPARAEQPDRARAKEAYDRGVEAHQRGEPRQAAAEFARADAISPSTVTLQAALDAAIEADDAALGAELLARSKREPPPPALASSITSAHFKFTGRAGRIRVVCPPATSCTARVDDRTVEVDKVVWAQTGQRSISITVEGSPHTKLVDVTPDQLVEVASGKTAATPLVVTMRPLPAEAEPSSASSAARHDHERGLPPIVFLAGVGLTVVLAGTALYFGVDAGHQHRNFKNAGCATANFTDCADIRTRGQDSQTAANVSLVLMGLSAAATAAVGLTFTNWKGPIVTASPTGLGAAWQTAF
jgi:hypothetical protein